MKFKRLGDTREFEVELVSHTGSQVGVRIDGREVAAEFETLPDGSVLIGSGARRYRVFGERRKDSIVIAAGPASFVFVPVEDRSGVGGERGLATPEVTAPFPAKVLKVLVAAGDEVAVAQPLLVIEAMKMETTLSAESPAVVKKVLVEAGQMVDHGTVLLELSPAPASSGPQSDPPDP